MPLALIALVTLAADDLEASLDRVPDRKAEWRSFIAATPKAQRTAAEYLLRYMPLEDLRSLPTAKVADAIRLAYAARSGTAWGARVPQPIFLDSVVPYASVTEPRQSMRAEFQTRYLPLVAKAKTPGEAALAINKTLFKDYKVVYNTRRLRTDQSPPESIAQGMATCTGLSIMLVDALRAVGVPSRLAGIPSWPGRGGNHTWVEVWDGGRWHFIGAAEPDEKGLNHAWFAAEAGTAVADKAENAIYAVTYRKTDVRFPMVWSRNGTVSAENVTERYRHDAAVKGPRLMVEVKQGGERVMADVIALNAKNGDRCLVGKTLGPQADMNLHLSAPAKEGETYTVKASYRGKSITTEAKVTGDTVVRIDLDTVGPLADVFGDDPSRATAARKELAKMRFDAKAADAAWAAYKASPNAAMKADFDANVVKTADRTSPYKWRFVGEKPKNGWGLVIAMHGGGGAPKAVNDNQWEGMFKSYYRDHPEAGGYVYLALRAPNDEWNGFYDDAIVPLIDKLILQFVKYAEVDPNRVYACGASHGGYGTFVIGPKAPFRFAALHPAASAGTDGETAGENLRNVRFTWAIGETDTAYGRVERCKAFQKSWEEWRAKYGGFDGGMELILGKGHQIGEHERDKTAELLKYTRDAHPKRVVWTQTDDVIRRFYWLEALKPVDKGHIDATVEGNTITLVTKDQGEVALWLSSALVDLGKPVVVIRDGKRTTHRVRASLATYAEGLTQTGDPALSAPVRLVIP
ncbi:MAG: transglutaminase domain-containing protein [Fimbriimonas sp.]